VSLILVPSSLAAAALQRVQHLAVHSMASSVLVTSTSHRHLLSSGSLTSSTANTSSASSSPQTAQAAGWLDMLDYDLTYLAEALPQEA